MSEAGSAAVIIGGGSTVFLDWDTPGEGIEYCPYVLHTELWFKNSVITQVRGTTQWLETTGAPLYGFALTEVPGYQYHYDFGPVDPVAAFASRRYDGDTKGLSGFGVGPPASGWTEDLGWTSLYEPGHQDANHQSWFAGSGGPQNIIKPYGDLEYRKYFRARRYGPRNVSRARLYLDHNYNYGTQQWETDFDLVSRVYTGWGTPDLTADLTFYIEQGVLTTSSRADPFAMTVADDFTVYWTINDMALGSVELDPLLGIDIGFRLGAPGAEADAYWGDWFCPLVSDPLYVPSPRFPSDPQPDIEFLFCPYHVGLLILDVWRFGAIPTQDSILFEAAGVEVTFPTAPGWGWDSNGQYHWLVHPNDVAPILSTGSWAERNRGGILHLSAPDASPDDAVDYAYRQTTVRADYDDVAQRAPSAYWAWQFCGHFEGTPGLGDDYGPALEARFGNAGIDLYVGSEELYLYGQSVTVPMGFDPFQRFVVRMVQSATGWAIKVWQASEAMPVGWTDWYNWTQVAGGIPSFRLWRDLWDGRAAIECDFICEGYYFWDLTGTPDPLVFVGSNPPTGGGVDESLAPACGGTGLAVQRASGARPASN